MIEDLFYKMVLELKDQGLSVNKMAKDLGISRANLFAKIKYKYSLSANFWQQFQNYYKLKKK